MVKIYSIEMNVYFERTILSKKLVSLLKVVYKFEEQNLIRESRSTGE